MFHTFPPTFIENLQVKTAEKEHVKPWNQQIYSDDTGEYNVGDIHAHARRNGKLQSFKIKDLEELNFQPSVNEHATDQPGSAQFVSRALKTDLSRPIHVVRYPDGDFIADGVHRLWHARSKGHTAIKGYLIDSKTLPAIKKSAAFHGSPTEGITKLEPRLDPRTGNTALFVKKDPESAMIYALLSNRARSNVSSTTKDGKFVNGHVQYRGDLLDKGWLYEVPDPPKRSSATDGYRLTKPVAPLTARLVTQDDARKAGWTWSKKAEYAPGIPDRHYHADLPEIKKPVPWKLSLQEHHADRAGHHYDLRLIDPDTGHAHSWALPKATMPEPGKSVLALQQPTHTADYALNFGKDKEQTIAKGYGKGRVKIKALEDIEVYHSKPEAEGTRVRFNVYKSTGPEEYAIVRTSGGQDLLVNKTLARHRLPHLNFGEKPTVKNQDLKSIDLKNKDEVMMPKYDGAHTILDLDKTDRIPRLFSYRVPKRHGAGVIEHTHKVQTLLTTRVPKELRGTVLRTETIAVDSKGRSIPAKDIAGMLNATVTNSRAKQEAMDARLVPIILDVEKYKGKSVQDKTFRQRYEMAKEISTHLHMPVTEAAFDTASKRKMLAAVQAGKHPMTHEGVVVRPLDTLDSARKAKLRPDHDVYVRNIFEAVNKTNKGTGRAGGFTYSWTPKGPIVGRVGTGFDHTTARAMLENPSKYKGRVARIEAEQMYASGALGKPSFKDWHHDK